MNTKSRRFQLGLLAAIMAATLQFVLWAGVLSGAAGPSASPTLSALNAGQCTTGDIQGHHHAPGPACLLCPVCLALSLPGTLPAVPPMPAPPSFAGRAEMAALAMPAPPPALVVAAAYPRGPPLI